MSSWFSPRPASQSVSSSSSAAAAASSPARGSGAPIGPPSILGPQSLAWELPPVSGGSSPTPRTYSTFVEHDGQLWLFGGYGENKRSLNDVCVFKPQHNKWDSVLTHGDAPRPVYLHTAVVYDRKMWVFGGNVASKESDELHVFDFLTSTWSRVNFSNGPPARYGHAACVIGENMIIVGGCKKSNAYWKDSWSYNFRTRQWRKMNDVTVDLAYHTLFVHDNRVYLYGGYNGGTFYPHMNQLETNSGTWNVVQVSGDIPPPTCGCACVVFGPYLYAFAGYTQSGHMNDLYRCHLPSRVWEKIPCDSKPIARAYLQAALLGGYMFVFGGFDGTHCLADFRRLPLPPPIPQVGPEVNMTRILSDNDVGKALEQALRYFSTAQSPLAPGLTKAELIGLFQNFQTNLQTMRRSAANSAPIGPSGAPESEQDYTMRKYGVKFDTSMLSQILDIGFGREHVLQVMAKLHKEGKDTRNLDLVVHRCLNEPPEQPQPSLSRQNSGGHGGGSSGSNADVALLQAEIDKLKKQVAAKMDEDDSCSICLDNAVNCAILECGHVCICYGCADGLRNANQPCPICRKDIRSVVRIYRS